MSTEALISSEDFNPLTEHMDLSKIHDKAFTVAVSTGPRDQGKFLCTTMHGPYSFDEMVQEVSRMWVEDQNNSKVYVLEKDSRKPCKWLDVNTTEYIQFRAADILLERMLQTFDDEAYTSEARIVEDDPGAE